MKVFKKLIASLATVAFLTVSVVGVSHAKIIDAPQYLTSTERQANLAIIDAAFARDDVQAQMVSFGVDADDALLRVNSLTDNELQTLAEQMETLPAGGGVFGLIGAVFVVLLILELTGVIDIFKKM